MTQKPIIKPAEVRAVLETAWETLEMGLAALKHYTAALMEGEDPGKYAVTVQNLGVLVEALNRVVENILTLALLAGAVSVRVIPADPDDPSAA